MAEWTEDEFRWDPGPSVVTMRLVLDELFSCAGRTLDAYMVMLSGIVVAEMNMGVE